MMKSVGGELATAAAVAAVMMFRVASAQVVFSKFAKVKPTFPADLTEFHMADVSTATINYRSACLQQCNRHPDCLLACTTEETKTCHLYSAKVYDYWSGSDTDSNTFSACYTKWLDSRRIRPVNSSASSRWYECKLGRAIYGFIGKYLETCYCTQHSTNPWWIVDLGSSKKVSSAVVHTRQDGYTTQFTSVQARLGDSENILDNPVFDESEGDPPLKAIVTFKPKSPMTGRYLSFMSQATTVLTICDVEILA